MKKKKDLNRELVTIHKSRAKSARKYPSRCRLRDMAFEDLPTKEKMFHRVGWRDTGYHFSYSRYNKIVESFLYLPFDQLYSYLKKNVKAKVFEEQIRHKLEYMKQYDPRNSRSYYYSFFVDENGLIQNYAHQRVEKNNNLVYLKKLGRYVTKKTQVIQGYELILIDGIYYWPIYSDTYDGFENKNRKSIVYPTESISDCPSTKKYWSSPTISYIRALKHLTKKELKSLSISNFPC